MDILIFMYFVYVAIITILRMKNSHFLKKNKQLFTTINQGLNLFFTLYWWLFFTPFVEINSGVLTVGLNSFLVIYRNVLDFSTKPLYQILVGSIGLIMTNATSFIILYCFRSYEFGGTNYVKRRFRFLVMIQSFVRFFITFFYYLNLTIVIKVKHLLGNFIAFSFYYDFYINWPFFNQGFAKFYICSVVTY